MLPWCSLPAWCRVEHISHQRTAPEHAAPLLHHIAGSLYQRSKIPAMSSSVQPPQHQASDGKERASRPLRASRSVGGPPIRAPHRAVPRGAPNEWPVMMSAIRCPMREAIRCPRLTSGPRGPRGARAPSSHVAGWHREAMGRPLRRRHSERPDPPAPQGAKLPQPH